jgi:alkylresorcinol/alkylpyrone synthase
MPKIVDVKTVFPKNYYAQAEIAKELEKFWPEKALVVDRFSKTSLVEKRHTAIELKDYGALGDFEKRNQIYESVALDLLEQAITNLLQKYDLAPQGINLIFSTTITGLAIPSLDARLMNRLNFNENTKRTPIFGLGCLGGVAGVNRVSDYLKAYPKEAALHLCVELCTLTFQFDDISMANLVATSLFGDGASACLMVGDEHPLAHKAKLDIIDGQSQFYPQTERIMGWDIKSTGFQIVLSGDVPSIVKDNVPKNIESFISKHKLTLDDIEYMIGHPGGPKVLVALAESLGKPESFLKYSYESLKENGNMSSVSVMNVLEKTLEREKLKNRVSLMMAMGPAFCSEYTLVKGI